MAEEQQFFWLGELILVLFIFLTFLGSLAYLRDPSFQIQLVKSKDIVLVNDATLASAHNINTTFTLPNATKLVLNQEAGTMGVAKISKSDQEALVYYYIKNSNLKDKLQYNLIQPEEKKQGVFNITIKNE